MVKRMQSSTGEMVTIDWKKEAEIMKQVESDFVVQVVDSLED